MRQTSEKAHQKMLQAMIEKDEHFKLYKAGKVWLIAGLATFAFAVAPQVVHADTTDTVAQTAIDQPTANGTVTSQAATTETAATSTATSSAATSSAAISNATDAGTHQAASDAASSAASTSSAAPASEATIQKITTSAAAPLTDVVSTSKPVSTSSTIAQKATNSTAPASTATTAAQTANTTNQTTVVAAPASAHQPVSNTTVSTGTAVTADTTVPVSTVEQVTAELPTGAVVNTLNGGLVATLPMGTDIDVVKQRLSASNLTVPVTLNTAAAEATYSDSLNKVNVTLSTDTIGYNSGASVLTIGLHMNVVAGDTLSMTVPTDSPIIKWGGFAALPNGIGLASTVSNSDGTTTYNATFTASTQIDQDLTLQLATNTGDSGPKTIAAAEIGTTTQQITWSVNGVAQTPMNVTQTISPKTTIVAPTRVHPKADVAAISPNSDYVYAVSIGESTGVKDDSVVNTVAADLNTGGATVKIPVPTSFVLNEADTATYNNLNSGTTITQPGGQGGDVIISVATGKGGNKADPYYIIGQYQMTSLPTETTLMGAGPIVFTQNYDDGQSIVTEGPTWTETLATNPGNSIAIKLNANGNSGTSSSELVLDANTSNDPQTLSNLTFEMNASGPVTDGAFTLTIPDGIHATGIAVPEAGISLSDIDDKLYLPNTTSYDYTLTLTDGTVETGSVAAGTTITAKGTAGIQQAVLEPNYIAAGAYIAVGYQIGIQGTVATNYADGTAVKNGDQLKFTYTFTAPQADGTLNTATADKIETVTAPIGHFIAWQHQYGIPGVPTSEKMPGGRGVLDVQQNGESGQTTDDIYEPILYFVIPKNATVTGYFYPKTDHPTITIYQTDDGRTGVKMDYTGTGEYVNTFIGTGTYGVEVINSLDALSGTSQASYYVTSPNTQLDNTKKVTDLTLTDGDANAVEYSVQDWTVITASAVTAATMAQGNLNTSLVAAGTADERGDKTITYAYNLVNSSGAAATDAAAVINLPTVGDTLGSTFTFNLTGPITVPTVYTESGTPETTTVLYATSLYAADAASTTPDSTNFVTADNIHDWSTVRAVYINFGSVPANDTTGRVLLTGTTADFIVQADKVGYLNTFTYDDGAPVSTPTVKTATKVTISGTSTITARVHYTDLNGQDQYIALDDLTRTLTDNKDTLANDYPTTVADFSEADQALLPVGYSLTGTTVVNSATTYPDGMVNGTAIIGNVSQYDFDGDIVQFELTRDQPTTATKVLTKVVHYVDEAGQAIADNYVDAVAITQITDKAADTVTYEPSQDVLGHQANPTIKGYTVQTSPAEATSDQSVTFGSDNIEDTVVYAEDTPTMNLDTVTKTVHYVDQAGQSIAPDFVSHANFTEIVDPVSDKSTYGPESANLAGQTNPTIAGYHVVQDDTAAAATQTVQFGDADLEYPVVYNKDTPSMGLDTVEKTVHYVDQSGNIIAPDYVSQANITRTTDPVTGQYAYGPATATVAGQDNPIIAGYHVVTNPIGATRTAIIVYFGDSDVDYTVIYAANPDTDNDGTPENNGGTTTPSNNGGITISDSNDDTTVPAQPSAAATVTTGNSTVTPNPTAATMATASNEKTAQSSNTDTAAPSTGTKATTLPQTGDETQPQLALLGASMLALLGLVGYRRKRD